MSEQDNDVTVESKRDLVIPNMSGTDSAYRDKRKRFLAIKELIERNPNRIITLADINKAARFTMASIYINELINSGCVVRYSLANGEKGNSFGYRWVRDPQEFTEPGPDEKSYYIKDLQEEYLKWCDEINKEGGNEEALAMKQRGVLQFIQMLENKNNNSAPHEKDA